MRERSLDKLPQLGAESAAPRAKGAWRVAMKTFGTKHYINVVARDLSVSGMLVKVEDPKVNAPFQTKTLLEMIFFPDGVSIKEEIKMTGVVVRSVCDDLNQNRKDMFGIRITEAPEAFEQAVESLLHQAS
jgi:hypothetical protein